MDLPPRSVYVQQFYYLPSDLVPNYSTCCPIFIGKTGVLYLDSHSISYLQIQKLSILSLYSCIYCFTLTGLALALAFFVVVFVSFILGLHCGSARYS